MARTVKLSLDNSTLDRFQLSARQKFLAHIVEPDIFFLLLLGRASWGCTRSSRIPASLLPALSAASARVLALYAMHLLPVNFAGVMLILLALALFILEAKFASHGVLADRRHCLHASGRHVS